MQSLMHIMFSLTDQTPSKHHLCVASSSYVLIIGQWTFFCVRRDVMLATFSSGVQKSAALILSRLQQKGGMAFNGLHLRMENDLADLGFVDREGGFEVNEVNV